MKQYIHRIRLTMVVSVIGVSCWAQAGSLKPVIAENFYAHHSSRQGQLAQLVSEITTANHLEIKHYKSPRDGEVTRFTPIGFKKEGDQIYAIAGQPGQETSIYKILTAEQKALVQDLFLDLERGADFIDSYNTGYGSAGGGVYFTAKNLQNINELSVTCAQEKFSDGSGEMRCQTRADGVDVSLKAVRLFRVFQGVEQELERLPWGSDAFAVSTELIRTKLQLFLTGSDRDPMAARLLR